MRTTLSRGDHKEARRLRLMSCHIPYAAILAGSWMALTVLSAVLTILAQGPVNPIP
jgi:hypothetical protein